MTVCLIIDIVAARTTCSAAVLALAMTAGATGSQGQPGTVQWIDTHVHVTPGPRNSSDDYASAVGQALDVFDEHGFARAILMPPPQRDARRNGYSVLENFVDLAREHPGRFAVMGGGGSLNPMITKESPNGRVSAALRKRFEERAEEILALGAVGFGEMTALHFSLTDNHPFESVEADHPLLLLLADIAARHDVPIDLHIEPVVEDIETPAYLRGRDNPARIKRNIDGFERLLAHNRKAKIVWAHSGTALLPHRTVALTRDLMRRHPNLYLQLGVLPGKVKQLQVLSPKGIKPPWLKLIREFPDRIVVGGDQFFSPPSNRGPAAKFSQAAPKIRKRFEILLSGLPPDIARKVAYENTIRIYKLER